MKMANLINCRYEEVEFGLTLYVTFMPRIQRLDPFSGFEFNIVLLITKVNRLEVPNSHPRDQ